MEKLSDDRLILTFAENLLSKKVDSKAIVDSLNFICRHFSLDGGAVYEIDQFNHFHAKESSGNICRESFALVELHNDYCKQLIKDTHVLIAHMNSSITATKESCALFDVKNLILYPVMDNTEQILGFLQFYSQQEMLEYQADEEHIFHVALSILAKYAGRRMYENKLSFAQTSLQSVLDNTGIDIYVNDFNTHDILYVNKSMAAPYGGIKEFEGRKCWEVLFPGQGGSCEFCPQKKIVDEHGEPSRVYTWDYQRPFDGSWFRVFSAAFRWVDGRLAHVVSSADITDNKKYEALIDHMANYDALTDLPNRRKLISECEKRIVHATEREKGYILFFDIDGFKAINDNHGHHSGDEFLIMLAKFFSDIPMLKNSIYRNGGDEFVAVIGGEDVSKANIKNLCMFIAERFKKPWKLEKASVYCSTSIGVACYPEDGVVIEDLLHWADKSMYYAKRNGGAGLCFASDIKNET